MTYDYEESVKLTAGRYKVPVTLKYKGEKIFLFCPFNRTLINEFKVMEGAKWHGFDKPPIKAWSIKSSIRNHFALSFLKGNNPYAQYQEPLEPMMEHIRATMTRPMYEHQIEMCAQILVRHYCINAGEMGTGKSLAFIAAAEIAGIKATSPFDCELLYVGPKSGVFAVGREFVKWGSPLKPKMMTYEGLVKAQRMLDFPFGDRTPRYVIFDESSKIKNPTAKRTMAALALSEKVKDVWMRNGYVVLASGTPSPRVPVDWWSQAETACPGYLREGNIHKFKQRLCIIEERESVTGGVYPHVVSWLDDENKCAVCGKYKAEPEHDAMVALTTGKKYHAFKKSDNEVEYLYQRMKGLVLVKFKRDCLDLPEKQYQIIQVKPTVDIIRKAQMITLTSTRAITALTLLRELSDGFQYLKTERDRIDCPMCKGTGKSPLGKQSIEDLDPTLAPLSFDTEDPADCPDLIAEDEHCPQCAGTGKVKRYECTAQRMHTPKDDVLSDILDDHDDVGRLVVWGGFTETIDKIIDLCHSKAWCTIRVDGRGYRSHDISGEMVHEGVFLDAMDASNPRYHELLEKYPRVCFVGHPKAGGMALTLTASPTNLFYSNGFDGEARMQAEDRIHRPGMDVNRGATIVDLIHLPSDKLVLENLQRKKRLQGMTMGELYEVIG
jgi:hypothetical protein